MSEKPVLEHSVSQDPVWSGSEGAFLSLPDGPVLGFQEPGQQSLVCVWVAAVPTWSLWLLLLSPKTRWIFGIDAEQNEALTYLDI